MKTETSTHDTDEFTLKEKLTYGIVGLVVLSGSFFIGRSIVRKARATSEEKKTYEDGNPATFAKQIKMAFENDNWFDWGTDEEAIRKIMQAVPSKEAMRKVINSYQKLYASSMMADMKDDLTTSEYNEMLAIIAAKPERGNSVSLPASTPQQFQSWAKRLKAAFDINYWFMPGTDEDAIKAVFTEMRSQADFWQTAQTYQSIYGNDLIKELRAELEFWEYGPMMDIVMKKPKA